MYKSVINSQADERDVFLGLSLYSEGLAAAWISHQSRRKCSVGVAVVVCVSSVPVESCVEAQVKPRQRLLRAGREG